MSSRNDQAGKGLGTFLQKSACVLAALLFLLMPANASTCVSDECSSPQPSPMTDCAGMAKQDCPAFLRAQLVVSCCSLDQIPSKSTNQGSNRQRLGHDSFAVAAYRTALNASPKPVALPSHSNNSPPDRQSLFCTFLI